MKPWTSSLRSQIYLQKTNTFKTNSSLSKTQFSKCRSRASATSSLWTKIDIFIALFSPMSIKCSNKSPVSILSPTTPLLSTNKRSAYQASFLAFSPHAMALNISSLLGSPSSSSRRLDAENSCSSAQLACHSP